MAIFKRLLLFVLGALLVLFLMGWLLPSMAYVERSMTIGAPPSTVFAVLSSFRRFNQWSPWYGRDPQAVYTLSGPLVGVGATLSWSSDRPEVGSGRQEIVATDLDRRIEMRLDFGEDGSAESFFNLDPVGSGTEVTWGFHTDFGSNLVERYFGLLFDRWVGSDYELGLTALAELVEGLPKIDWSDCQPGLESIPARIIASTWVATEPERDSLGAALERPYRNVERFITRYRLEPAGLPLRIFRSVGAQEWQLEIGVPITAAELDLPEDAPVSIATLSAVEAACATHVGADTLIAGTWDQTMAWVDTVGLVVSGARWEESLSDPDSTPEAERLVKLCVPIE